MSSWDLLDDKKESELHKTRLVNIEEKPFKRITKRLASISAIANARTKQQPTPPVEGANGEKEAEIESREAATNKDLREIDQIKEDLTLDFAAFDSSIARLQFLLDANVRERERYQADQKRILEECQNVRDNNAKLREQLDGAKATLAQRKEYDKLANALMAKGLRPRGEQETNLKKLEEEIRDLERESETYGVTWRERREQFSKIMDEGMLLRRQIRDEKEEVERREGMNEDEEDGEASRDGQTPRHVSSGNVTPHPDGSVATRTTPGHDGQSEDHSEGLKPRPGATSSFSRSDSAVPSQGDTPRPQQDDEDEEIEEGEDVEMDDRHDAQFTSGGDTPQITVDAPERMEVDN